MFYSRVYRKKLIYGKRNEFYSKRKKLKLNINSKNKYIFVTRKEKICEHSRTSRTAHVRTLFSPRFFRLQCDGAFDIVTVLILIGMPVHSFFNK